MPAAPKSIRHVDRELLDRVAARPCVLCQGQPSDPSHIRSRGAGGPDKEFNVAPHCRGHHQLWHSLGQKTFLKKFPVMRLWLALRGWDTDKMTHPELDGS